MQRTTTRDAEYPLEYLLRYLLRPSQRPLISSLHQ